MQQNPDQGTVQERKEFYQRSFSGSMAICAARDTGPRPGHDQCSQKPFPESHVQKPPETKDPRGLQKEQVHPV